MRWARATAPAFAHGCAEPDALATITTRSRTVSAPVTRSQPFRRSMQREPTVQRSVCCMKPAMRSDSVMVSMQGGARWCRGRRRPERSPSPGLQDQMQPK